MHNLSHVFPMDYGGWTIDRFLVRVAASVGLNDIRKLTHKEFYLSH